jgi:hypothetical protein
MEEDGEPPAGTGGTGGTGGSATGSQRVSRRSSAAGTSGSPGSRTRAASAEGSRRSSKRSISGMFHAAAAVAAAAEAAAVAAVGYALGGGRDRSAAAEQEGADGGCVAPMNASGQQQPGLDEPLSGPSASANSLLRQRLGEDARTASTDSFTLPPFMPLAGSITVTGSRSGLNLLMRSNGGSANTSSAGAADELMADAAAEPAELQAMETGAAAAAGDRELADRPDGMNWAPAAGTSAATAALLRRQQQLLGSDGSEWGSGALSGLQQSSSGIDSPTGSAVFRLAAHSPHTMEHSDSMGSGSVPPGELNAALESLAVQHPGSAASGANRLGSIGASRMGREAAAAAAGAPVGAAALMVGYAGSTADAAKAALGLSEITPASDIGATAPADLIGAGLYPCAATTAAAAAAPSGQPFHGSPGSQLRAPGTM